jgi:iron-sulfur cluster repair protein YtfE (RIC family)
MEQSPSVYEKFSLGLRFSHRALLRNLHQFACLSRAQGRLALNRADRSEMISPARVADYILWFEEFLDVHHHGEDDHIFPALRRHSAGRSTDIAHLDEWAREHEEIYRLSRTLRVAARSLHGDPNALDDVQRRASELTQLLTPHLEAEEGVLTPDRLREMIPEKELASAQLAIPRSQRTHALRMAQFFVHSLQPAEQRELLGDTPWIFRKLVLGTLGAGRTRRCGALMPVRELYI